MIAYFISLLSYRCRRPDTPEEDELEEVLPLRDGTAVGGELCDGGAEYDDVRR